MATRKKVKNAEGKVSKAKNEKEVKGMTKNEKEVKGMTKNEKEVKKVASKKDEGAKEAKKVTEQKDEGAKEAKKVTEQKVSKAERIRQLYLEGLNYYQISKVLGVRPQYARNVIVYAVESPSGYKKIKAEYEKRLKAKQAAAVK